MVDYLWYMLVTETSIDNCTNCYFDACQTVTAKETVHSPKHLANNSVCRELLSSRFTFVMYLVGSYHEVLFFIP